LGNNLVKRRVWISDENEWEQICHNLPLNELGWKLGKPRPIKVEYVENKLVRKGKTLDLCCGAGTNTVHLAQNGFDVTGMDISLTAVAYAKAKLHKPTSKYVSSCKISSSFPSTMKDSTLFMIWGVSTT
jgi:2-polyprenyl-3-methyl-5-hydroxy-6-metoxy-1,4-benzoquinol methylase